MENRVTIDSWEGCYARGWGDLLTPLAYSHPAKVRPELARRIYEHVLEEGWVQPGAVVLDPFCGIGGFAFHALYYGLHFVGMELESKFCLLANQNIALWNRKFKSTMPNWGIRFLPSWPGSMSMWMNLRSPT